MNFLVPLEKLSHTCKIVLGFTLIGVIGVLDYLTGFEIAFSSFYVIPISFITWLMTRRLGIIASFVSASIWLWADIASGHSYLHPLIPLWNGLIRLSFFLVITYLLSALKESMMREKLLARTDFLTGAANSRSFFELLHVENDRMQRFEEQPFTLVYIDLDNFKTVNDQLGHHTGDNVLRTVVEYAVKHLRKIDVIARLGGDEFALLLPETSQESAHVVIAKLHSGLLEEMQLNSWPITFSIGVLTCNVALHSTEELLKIADELMYAVKCGSKNAVKYSNLA